MNKETAHKTGRFINDLVKLGVAKYTDEVFEGIAGLSFEPITPKEAQKILYVGDRVFHYWYNRTSYDLLIVAEKIILLVSDADNQVFSSIEVYDGSEY